MIFTGSDAGLSVFAVGSGGKEGAGGREGAGGTSGEVGPLRVVAQSGPPAVTDLHVGHTKNDELNVQLVAATLETGKPSSPSTGIYSIPLHNTHSLQEL